MKEEKDVYGSSSTGRAAVSKTAGWGFESLLPCATDPNVTANNMFRKVKAFLSEVKVELMKASWPWEPKEKGMKKYKELIDSTLLVLIAMLLLSGYVALWDFLMLSLSSFLTKIAGS
jgi:preprotein translocase subunit SecE